MRSAAVAVVPIEIDGEALVVRPSRPEERRVIKDLWLHSYKGQSKVNPTIYDKWHPDLVDRLMHEFGVWVVCSGTLDTTILGWACGEAMGSLHYAYVPFELRGNGIGRMAITAALGDYPTRIDVTHRFVGRANSFRFTHNPYRAGLVP